MNIQLVESLANAIKALSPEERELLNQKLTAAIRTKPALRGLKPLSP